MAKKGQVKGDGVDPLDGYDAYEMSQLVDAAEKMVSRGGTHRLGRKWAIKATTGFWNVKPELVGLAYDNFDRVIAEGMLNGDYPLHRGNGLMADFYRVERPQARKRLKAAMAAVEEQRAAEAQKTGVRSDRVGPVQVQDLVLMHGGPRNVGVIALQHRMTETDKGAVSGEPLPVLQETPAIWATDDFLLADAYNDADLKRKGQRRKETDESQVYYLDIPQARVVEVDTKAKRWREDEREAINNTIKALLADDGPDVLLLKREGFDEYFITDKVKPRLVKVENTDDMARRALPLDTASGKLGDFDPESVEMMEPPSPIFCQVALSMVRADIKDTKKMLRGASGYAQEQLEEHLAGAERSERYWAAMCADEPARWEKVATHIRGEIIPDTQESLTAYLEAGKTPRYRHAANVEQNRIQWWERQADLHQQEGRRRSRRRGGREKPQSGSLPTMTQTRSSR